MDLNTNNRIIDIFSRHLESDEDLISVGAFKKVPSTSCLLLTRGMAWFFAEDFYVGVTTKRLIILPKSMKNVLYTNVISVDLNQVEFYEDAFNNSILKVQVTYKGQPLKLRFKSRDQTLDWNPFDFIAAVQQGKHSSETAQA